MDLGIKTGAIAYERMGCAMAGAGNRWFVGASGGAPFVIVGGAVHPLVWNPTTGLAYSGLVLAGNAGDLFGTSIAAVPGGGIIVGAPGAQVPTIGQAGKANVYDTIGALIGVVSGRNSNGTAGNAVAGIGDLDGDSIDDYLVGQPHWAWTSCAWTSDWSGCGIVDMGVGTPTPRVATVDGVAYCGGQYNAYAIVDYIGAHSQSLAGVGNITGNGTPAFAVGITNRSRVDIYTWSPTTSSLSLVRSDTGMPGFGKAICSVGDVNGNGSPDYAVGAPDSRRVEVREGSDGSLIRAWDGAATDFGHALALLGDQDGDGHPELAIGAPGSGQDAGEVCVFSLTAGRERLLARIRGRDPASRFGASLCRVGDQTGDGNDELGIGAPETAVNSLSAVGRAYLITLDERAFAAFGHTGNGCVMIGAAGPSPRLGASLGLAHLGKPFAFSASNAQSSAFGFLVLDYSALVPPVALPTFGPGCTDYVAPLAFAPSSTASRVASQAPGLGNMDFSLGTIPNNPGLVGILLWAQAYVGDQGVPYPGSLSNAFWVVVLP